MGGNALKKVKSSRLNISNYNLVKKEILKKFSPYIDILYLYDVPGKIDFGDIDVLYKHHNDSFNLHNFIIETYQTPDIVSNGSVISFALPFDHVEENKLQSDVLLCNKILSDKIYFQVDFIKSKNLKMSHFYFSFGDLGNIIGRITKFHGLRFGDNGLFLNINSDTVKEYYESNNLLNINDRPLDLDNNPIPYLSLANSDEIILTQNPEEICSYIGLDYSKWNSEYFTSLDKIFEWITKTPLFVKKIFTHLNCPHRHKILTRPMYNKFVEYIGCDNIQSLPNAPLILESNKQLDALVYFNKIKDLDDVINYHKTIKIRSDKFNANKIKVLNPGIDGKNLGNYIIQFKKYIDNNFNKQNSFNDWLDKTSREEVENILNEYNQKYL
jgi:hypothetical protein